MKKLTLTFICLFSAVPCQADEIVCFNMDSDPGWVAEGQWEFGVPQGGGGPFSYDPCSGYTGHNVYGYNLAGNYDNDMPEYKLTTSAINCKLAENVTLGFWRWLGVESSLYDCAKVQASNNGTSWTDVWSNGTSNLADSSWVYCEYDISAVADRQEAVYIRWCMGPTDFSNVYAGWNIDDVCLEGDVLDALSVSPDEDFTTFGFEGGPFSPACKSYTLTNEGTSDVNWFAEATQSWIEITPDSGTLVPDGNVVVNVCITEDANMLSEGLYTGNLSFANMDSGFSYMIGATLYVGDALIVPLQYSTIQSAIDASSDGETIVVLDGAYSGSGNRDIDFKGRAITVRSLNGPESCIIDCGGDTSRCRGFYFHSYEDKQSVVDGFTIKRGWKSAPGAGIYCKNSSPTIRNCTITLNYSVAYYDEHAYGGGIYCDNSSPTIHDCTISNNTGGELGGGIYCCNNSCPEIINCTIAGNKSFTPNVTGAGGGMYNSQSNPTLINCAFSGNKSPVGGGMYNSKGNPTLTNCTFSGNSTTGLIAGDDGYVGGMYNRNGKPVLTNCIFWGNRDAGGTDQSSQISTSGAGGPVINYSCVQGWTGGLGGTGNIGDDPCFISGPLGDYYLSQVAAGQVTNSPCVDTGSDTAVNLGLNTFTTRIDEVGDDAMVDMGYHYPLTTCPVDIDGDEDVDFVDYALFATDFGLKSKTIPRGAVVVDGNLSEWSGDIQWRDLDKIYYGIPNDVDEARFALRWDPNTNRIYAALVVQDINHMFLDEYVHWDASDRLEIYSQGDAAGGTGWQGEYDIAQQYYVGPNTTNGCWATWALGEPIDVNAGFEYAVDVNGSQVIYEVGVTPFENYGGITGGETIVTDLDVGDVVGFDVVVCTRSSDSFGMLSENMMTGKYLNAGQFARYTLVENLETPACSEPPSDMDGNCEVNLEDLAILVEYWLWGR